MNIQKIRDFFHEIIDVLIYPFILIEKSEKAAHHRDFAKKKNKKPSTLNSKIGVIPAEKFRTMLAKTNGTTPAQPTNRQPETNKRPNIHIGMVRLNPFKASLAKNGNSPAIRQTEEFIH